MWYLDIVGLIGKVVMCVLVTCFNTCAKVEAPKTDHLIYLHYLLIGY